MNVINNKKGVKKEIGVVEQVTLNRYKCERCEHIWLPRDQNKPTVCPKCKSPYWDKPIKSDGQ